MPDLPPLVGKVVFDTAAAEAQLEALKGTAADFGVAVDQSTLGAGASLDTLGAKATEDAAVAGAGMQAARSSVDDVAEGLAGAAGNLGTVGDVAGKGAQDLSHDLDDLAGHTDNAATHTGLFEKAIGSFGTTLSSIGSKLGNFGLPFTESLTKAGDKMSDVEGNATSLAGKLSTLGGVALVAGGAAFAAVAAEGVHLAMTMQSVDASIAANAGISTAAAKKIGTAFLDTAGKVHFSGEQIGTAFSSNAAVLGTLEGHALTTKEAMSVMDASMTLATATGNNLTSTTKSLTQAMQAFGTTSGGAAGEAGQLYETTKLTGVSMTSFGTALQRLHSQLGTTMPTLSQAGGLLVDMAQHGDTGRTALRSLSTAMNALLKPSQTLTKAQHDLTTVTGQLTATLASLAARYESGSLTSADMTAATKTLSTEQGKLWSQFTSAAGAVTTAKTKLAELGITVDTATGKFVGMASVITQLHKQVAGMTQAQALATLSSDGLGKSAQGLLSTVEAGLPAYEKATAAVDKKRAVEDAEAKQQKTLKDELETLKASLEDYATKIGQDLIPILQALGHDVADVIGWFEKHKDAAYALAAMIGAVLAVAVGAFAIDTMGKMVNAISTGITTIESFGASIINGVANVLGFDDVLTTASATEEELASTTAATGQQVQSQTAEIVGAIDRLTASFGGMATEAESAGASVQGSFAGMEAGASEAAASMSEVEAASAAAAGEEGIGAVTGGLGSMLGPIGLAAGAIGGLLLPKLAGLFSTGPTMAAVTKSVTALNQAIAKMPTTNVVALGTAIGKLKTDLGQAQSALGNADPGSTAFATASAKVTDLTQKTVAYLGKQAELTANTQELINTFGLTTAQVQEFAAKAGLNLQKALTPSAVDQFRKAMEKYGTASEKASAQAAVASGAVSSAAKTAAASLLTSDHVIVTGHKTALETMVALSQATGPVAIAELADSMKGGLPSLEAVDKAMGVDLPKKYLDLLNTAMSKGGYVAMTKLTAALQAQQPHVETGFRFAIENSYQPAMSEMPAKMSAAAQVAFNSLNDAIAAAGPALISAMSSDVTAAVKMLTKYSATLGNIGVTLMNGLASGIRSGSSAAVAAAEAAITTAIAAAKFHAEISSPSARTAREIGVPWSQGVAAGILAGLGGIHSASQQAVDYIPGLSAGLLGASPGLPAPAFGAGAGAGGGGGDTIVISVPVMLTGRQIASVVTEPMRVQTLRGKGRQTINILGSAAGRTGPTGS